MSRKSSKKAKRVQLTPEQLLNREQRKAFVERVTKHDRVTSPISEKEMPLSVASKKEVREAKAFPCAELPQGNALLLTVADLCGLLKISRTTLFRLEKSGEIPGRLSLGGQVRYHRETVENWLRSLVRR